MNRESVAGERPCHPLRGAEALLSGARIGGDLVDGFGQSDACSHIVN
jgi:hypothetical protein